MGDANGVGSRFRATIYHIGSGSPENDSRPLPPDSTKKYLAGCLAIDGAQFTDGHGFCADQNFSVYPVISVASVIRHPLRGSCMVTSVVKALTERKS
jgi:hypothetical protein